VGIEPTSRRLRDSVDRAEGCKTSQFSARSLHRVHSPKHSVTDPDSHTFRTRRRMPCMGNFPLIGCVSLSSMAVGVGLPSTPKIQRIDVAVAACCIGFIAILAISAYWDPTIRVLHVVEAVPYVLAAVLSLRRSKVGYALGFASGGFWLWYAGTLVTFVRNGFQQVGIFFRTGQVDRPDVLIAAPAAIATGGMAVLSVVAYSRLRRKSWSDLAIFAGAVIAVVAFFIAIFAAFAPQYLTPLQRLLNLN
jgi:hypothetical protein